MSRGSIDKKSERAPLNFTEQTFLLFSFSVVSMSELVREMEKNFISFNPVRVFLSFRLFLSVLLGEENRLGSHTWAVACYSLSFFVFAVCFHLLHAVVKQIATGDRGRCLDESRSHHGSRFPESSGSDKIHQVR